MASPARLSLETVDITASRWSTDLVHRELARALFMDGRVAFMNLLCG